VCLCCFSAIESLIRGVGGWRVREFMSQVGGKRRCVDVIREFMDRVLWIELLCPGKRCDVMLSHAH
jgi:hypothetical protein